MEPITIIDDAQKFDKAVHGGLPEAGDLKFIHKPYATTGGKGAVCVTFTVQLPSGELATAQAVTTVNNLIAVGDAMRGYKERYGNADSQN